MKIEFELRDKMFVAHGDAALMLHSLFNRESQTGFYFCEGKKEIGIMFEELKTILKEKDIKTITMSNVKRKKRNS